MFVDKVLATAASDTTFHVAELGHSSVSPSRSVRDFSRTLQNSTVMQKYRRSASPAIRPPQPAPAEDEQDVRQDSRVERKSEIRETQTLPSVRFESDRSPSPPFTPSRRYNTDGNQPSPRRQGNKVYDLIILFYFLYSSILESRPAVQEELEEENKYSAIEKITIDPTYLRGVDDVAAASAAAIKVFLLFEKWMLHRVSENGLRHREERIIPLQFHCHLATLNDFASDLFGLERWLRDKVKEFVLQQTKLQLLRRWGLYTGVMLHGRLHHHRHSLRRGFESWMEFNLKSRMQRKNALQAFAWRRTHVDRGSMAMSIARNTRRSLFFTQAETTSDESFALTTEQLQERIKLAIDYKTSLSVRKLLQVAQLQYRSQYQDRRPIDTNTTSPSQRKLMLANRSVNYNYSSGTIGVLKLQQYHSAQDLVALMFAFRRFFHRTTLLKRFALLRNNSAITHAKKAFHGWRMALSHRRRYLLGLEPQLDLAHQRILDLRAARAFKFIKRNVSLNRQERAMLAQCKQRIFAASAGRRAVYLFRFPLLVRCFMQLKNDFLREGVPMEMNEAAAGLFRHIGRRRALHKWLAWQRVRAARRLSVFRRGSFAAITERVLKIRRRGLQQQRHHHSQYGGYHSSSSHQSMNNERRPLSEVTGLSRAEAEFCINYLHLRRHLLRLRTLSHRPKVFTSLLEMKFVHSLSRFFPHDVTGGERARWKHLSLRMSTSLPRKQLSSEGREFRLLNMVKANEKRNRDEYDRQVWQLLSFPAAAFDSSMLLSDDQFAYLSTNDFSSHSRGRLVGNFLPLAARRLLRLHDDQRFFGLRAESLLGKSVPVGDYLQRLGEQFQHDSHALESTFNASMRLKWAVGRWFQHRIHRLAYTTLAASLRHKAICVSLGKWWRTWQREYIIHAQVSKWRRRRGMNRFLIHTRACAVFQQSNDLVTRRLQYKAVKRLLLFKTERRHTRLDHAQHFYNSFMDHITSDLLYFITHSGLLVPYPLRHFLLLHASFRFSIENDEQGHEAQSLIVDDHVHTSVKKNTAGIRRISRGSIHSKEETKVSSLNLSRYLAQVIPVFELLKRKFQRLRDRALIHCHCKRQVAVVHQKQQRLTIAVMKRNMYFAHLTNEVRRRRKRWMLERWKAIWAVHRMLLLEQARFLHEWNKMYRNAVFTRVWDMAWGSKIRSTWQRWRDHTNDYNSRSTSVQSLLRRNRIKSSWVIWRVHRTMSRYYKKNVKGHFLRQLKRGYQERVMQQRAAYRATIFYAMFFPLKLLAARVESSLRQRTLLYIADMWRFQRLLALGLQRLSRGTRHSGKKGIKFKKFYDRMRNRTTAWRRSNRVMVDCQFKLTDSFQPVLPRNRVRLTLNAPLLPQKELSLSNNLATVPRNPSPMHRSASSLAAGIAMPHPEQTRSQPAVDRSRRDAASFLSASLPPQLSNPASLAPFSNVKGLSRSQPVSRDASPDTQSNRGRSQTVDQLASPVLLDQRPSRGLSRGRSSYQDLSKFLTETQHAPNVSRRPSPMMQSQSNKMDGSPAAGFDRLRISTDRVEDEESGRSDLDPFNNVRSPLTGGPYTREEQRSARADPSPLLPRRATFATSRGQANSHLSINPSAMLRSAASRAALSQSPYGSGSGGGTPKSSSKRHRTDSLPRSFSQRDFSPSKLVMARSQSTKNTLVRSSSVRLIPKGSWRGGAGASLSRNDSNGLDEEDSNSNSEGSDSDDDGDNDIRQVDLRHLDRELDLIGLTSRQQRKHREHIQLRLERQRIAFRRVYLWYLTRRHNPQVARFHSHWAAAYRSLQKLRHGIVSRTLQRRRNREATLLFGMKRWTNKVNAHRSRLEIRYFADTFHLLRFMKRLLNRWFRRTKRLQSMNEKFSEGLEFAHQRGMYNAMVKLKVNTVDNVEVPSCLSEQRNSKKGKVSNPAVNNDLKVFMRMKAIAVGDLVVTR